MRKTEGILYKCVPFQHMGHAGIKERGQGGFKFQNTGRSNKHKTGSFLVVRTRLYDTHSRHRSFHHACVLNLEMTGNDLNDICVVLSYNVIHGNNRYYFMEINST